MTDYGFDVSLVTDQVGGVVRVARNAKITVTNYTTGVTAAGLKQNGQPVPWVTSDTHGRANFTSTEGVIIITSPNGLTRLIQSPDYLQENVTASASASSSATSAANSATSAQNAANLVGAPAGSAIDARLSGGFGFVAAASATLADVQAALDDATTNGKRALAYGTITTSSTLIIKGDCDLSQLTINYTGTGVAVQVGDPNAATFRKRCILPRVIATAKTVNGWAQVAGTIGVDIVNTYAYTVHVPYVQNCETNLRVRGALSNGAQQTNIHLGHLDNGKVNIRLTGDSTGWVNQNSFFGGRCSHNSNEGTQVVGTRHIVFESIANPVNSNQFFGTSLETPNVVEYHAEFASTVWNQLVGCRWENTVPANRRILVSGNSKNNHVVGGAYGEALTQVITSPAQPVDVTTPALTSRHGGTSTGPVMLLENINSNTAPILTFMAAGAGGANADPATAYKAQATANQWAGKRDTDSFPRAIFDYQNGRFYVGDGTAAPTVYLGATSGAVLLGGALPFGPVTTAAIDLGLSSLKWRNVYLSGAVGFFGSTPLASKPSVTGSRGGNAALASLLTTLASYGLITDSTTV